jgi:hypothetical protein
VVNNACEECAEKIRKEKLGASKSFLSYFLLESKTILYELGVTGSDSPQIVASKLLKEVKRLRIEVNKLTEELKPKEVPNAS